MSDNNFVDPEAIYPFVHPDDLEVVLDGPVGPEPFRVYTFDTRERYEEYLLNDKFPFSPNEGLNAYPQWLALTRINEEYEGVSGRLILFYTEDSGIESSTQPGQNISYPVEIPIRDPYASNPGASYEDGGLFRTTELPPTTLPAATLSNYGQVREATPPPTSEEPPSTKETGVEAAAEESAAPAKEETENTQAEVEEKLDPNDTATPVGEKVDDANTQLAANPSIESDIRNGAPPGSDAETVAAFEAKADQYAAAKTELAGGNLTLARTQELTKELDEIQKSLPPSLSSTASLISGAVTPALNPGNIPGLESIIGQATKIAGDFIPGANSAIGDITNAVDFASGLDLGSLSNLAQSVTSSLKSTSSLLGGGNLLGSLPDINSLFQFDPKALFKSIDLGAVVNSVAKLDVASIAKDLEGGLMDVVDQKAALFGPVGRSIPGRPWLGTDAGAGYVGSRSTSSGAPVAQVQTVAPVVPKDAPPEDKEEVASGNVYTDLTALLNKALTQDWAVKSGTNDGQKPSEQDPRPDDKIPDPPEGANPLIMEAYRISGQTELTRDGTTGEYSWHTAFVNYILSKAGLPIVVSTSAQSYYSYGNRVNHTNIRNIAARKGDIVIFNSKTGGKYIGFFWSYNKQTKKITVLGGNIEGDVKLEDFDYSLKDGNFYVTHIRRNWEVPKDILDDPDAADPRGDQVGDPRTPKESAIGPTGEASSRLDSKGATPEKDPDLARATFNDDGTVTLPPDATPAETAAVKTKLNNDRIQRDQDAFFNNDDGLSDEEYDAIEIPKKLTPEERKAKDAADKARKKAAAEEKRRKQAEEDSFYGGGAFATGNSNPQRVVNKTVTESGGQERVYESPKKSNAQQKAESENRKNSAVNTAKGETFTNFKRARQRRDRIAKLYQVRLSIYQTPSGKYGLR